MSSSLRKLLFQQENFSLPQKLEPAFFLNGQINFKCNCSTTAGRQGLFNWSFASECDILVCSSFSFEALRNEMLVRTQWCLHCNLCDHQICTTYMCVQMSYIWRIKFVECRTRKCLVTCQSHVTYVSHFSLCTYVLYVTVVHIAKYVVLSTQPVNEDF